MIVVIGSIYGDVDNLLPHFLKHYTDWEAGKFVFSVYRGKGNPAWNRIQDIGRGYPIELYDRGGTELNVVTEGEFKDEIRQQLSPDDYYIPVDLDEFHRVPKYKNFPDVIKDMKVEGADYVSGGFTDRIKEDGHIPPTIEPSASIWEQFPRECHISDTIAKAWCEKLCLAGRHVETFGGHHTPLNPERFKRFSQKSRTFHFKWFGPLYEKEKEKFRTYTSQNRKWVNEQKNLLEWLDTHNGKLI